ncbi:hypothetical protein ACSHWG_00945 [Leucobacter sp. Z1108]|uniref:hypothetical protein n=1 Tax=Leucobacter sp. Z1108 TaxID=3439066 RepID=UPI003F41251D
MRSLASVDVTAGVLADPDANETNLTEALALALDTTAPTIQGQLDEITDLILGGI